MENFKQLLNDGWYVKPESKDEGVITSMPALAKDFFPMERGAILYSKNFNLELVPDDDSRIYICFDRVVCGCEVWVNDKSVGVHCHSEQKFELDVTDALVSGENRVAIRVENIDVMNMPNYAQIYAYYTVVSLTGIYGEVSLCKKPNCKIADLYVNPQLDTKTLTVELKLENCKADCNAEIEYRIYEKGQTVKTASESVLVKENSCAQSKISFVFDEVKPWSPDDPYLYDIVVSVKTSGKPETVKKRFGFKSLYIEDGWFVLNGKRIFLTCAHSLVTKEAIIHAKTMGFKALRYLSAMPSEEILDFCDEAGMLVYEECAVAWGMHEYDGMEKDMSLYLDNMLLRDRSHVSVGIWGLFNEHAGPNGAMRDRILGETTKVFEFGVSYLPKLRELDNERLILLSSGRWDARPDVGSFSNPHSSEWNYGWGEEGLALNYEFQKSGPDIDPYISGLGDIHVYPTVPIQNDVRDFVRNVGKDSNPVFLSEYGVGYQLELYDLFYDLEKTAHKDHPSLAYYAIQKQRLEEWIKKYSLENVYPTARDFLMASINAGAQQRCESLDPVRANPKLCGYSLTSFSVSNEGVYFRDSVFVPGVVDAIKDSFAPLKWSIFMDKTQVYEQKPFELELVLCNEDVLDAGSYSATVSVSGSEGVAFRREITFKYPEGKPLAASVAKVNIDGLPAGEYTFSVHINGCTQPTCCNKKFRVHSLEGLPKLSGSFYPMGDIKGVSDFVCTNGMTQTNSANVADVVIVGYLAEPVNPEDVLNMARDGKRVMILDYKFWQSANTSAQEFMQSIEFDGKAESVFGNCIYVRNWLYHLDNYISNKTVFDGLAGVGLLDMDLFRAVYPDHYFTDTAVPSKTYCASFGSGLFAKDNCIAALTLGEYELGCGSVLVNTFKLLENVGKDPVADRILYNLFK